MAIYRIVEASNDYNSAIYSEAEVSLETIDELDGVLPIADSWKPIPVQVYSVGRQGDFLRFIPAVPVITERAWGHLASLLQGHAELLPLTNQSGSLKLFALHVTSVVDCVDPANAIVERFPEGNAMYPLERYAFLEDIANQYPVFRIPETYNSELLATEPFRELVLRAGLKGLRFKQLV